MQVLVDIYIDAFYAINMKTAMDNLMRYVKAGMT